MIVLRAFLFALSFLTKVPVPRAAAPSPRILGLSVAFFPVVGVLLGSVAALLQWTLCDQLALEPHLWWGLVLVGAHAFLTGGLHLDGLADVADGIGAGGHDRERALEIMRDSRVGSFGVMALVLVLTGKVIVMTEVLRLDESLLVLIAYPAAARFAAVPLVAFFPYARPAGLGRNFHDHSGWTVALVAVALAAAGGMIAGSRILVPAAAALGVSLLLGLWLWCRLRGLTGDVYGAAIELAELTFLFVAVYPRIGPVHVS